MKKSALKILALLMSLTLVMSFAACGNKTEDETTTSAVVPEETIAEDANATEAMSEDTTLADESSPVSEEATEAVSTEDTSVVEDSSAAEATTVASAGLNSTDVKEVVAYYNAAFAKTKTNAPKGQSTMKLDGSITGDGAIGAILKVLSPAAEKALAKNSTPTDYIPGHGNLTAADVASATATSKNGVTTIKINLKPQTDNATADPKVGPVGRGIGTLGNIDGAVKELGAELTEGKDTIKLTYNNAYISCKINEQTGRITGGTWHYTVNVLVGDAKAKLGLSFNLKNLKAKIDYQVVI